MIRQVLLRLIGEEFDVEAIDSNPLLGQSFAKLWQVFEDRRAGR